MREQQRLASNTWYMMLKPTCICCLIRPSFSSVHDRSPLLSGGKNDSAAHEGAGPACTAACAARNCCFRKLKTSAGSHLHMDTLTLPAHASGAG